MRQRISLPAVWESVSRLLQEGRLEDAKKTFPGPDNEILINGFVDRDPSGNLKYLQWQMKVYDDRQADFDDIAWVTELFHKYGNTLKKNDIYRWKPSEFWELYAELKDAKQAAELRNSWREQDKKNEDAARCEQKVIYNDGKWTVRHIIGKKASIHYGRGTTWCITMKDEKHFEDYTMNNVVFFFFVPKKPKGGSELDKFALAIQRAADNTVLSEEWYDAQDVQRDEFDVAEHVGANFEQMLAACRKTSREFETSPMAKVLAGKASAEEAIAVYKGVIGVHTAGIPDEETERIICKMLAIKTELPQEVLDDVTTRAVSRYYQGHDRIATFNLLIDREELSDDSLRKLANFDMFKYSRTTQDEFLTNLLHRGHVPADVENMFLEELVASMDDYYEHHLAAVSKAKKIPIEWQMKMASSGNLPIIRALVQNKTLSSDVYNVIFDWALANYDALVAAGDDKKWRFNELLRSLLLSSHHKQTDHIRAVLAKRTDSLGGLSDDIPF